MIELNHCSVKLPYQTFSSSKVLFKMLGCALCQSEKPVGLSIYN